MTTVVYDNCLGSLYKELFGPTWEEWVLLKQTGTQICQIFLPCRQLHFVSRVHSNRLIDGLEDPWRIIIYFLELFGLLVKLALYFWITKMTTMWIYNLATYIINI